ncbi:MAG: class I SAM-dependent RNA methyltransferase [Deltaproteobacteria bacterium]|nr:class I SAM-dependent RNA methyltransferase [Deltaproteobacteria bacterium]
MDTDTFILTIDSLSYGGNGVGRREDGKVVFVPMVIPGEKIRARVVKEHSKYVNASLVEILDKSPSRQKPRCPIFDSCGGCDWQHMPYQDQLQWKLEILRAEITKTSGAFPELVYPIVPSNQTFGYRGYARIQCSFDPIFKMGFFQKKSRKIAAFESCPILHPLIQDTLSALAAILKTYPVYSLYSLEIHAPGEDVLVSARSRGPVKPGDIKIMNSIYNDIGIAGLSFVVLKPQRRDYVLGQRYCRYTVHVQDKSIELSGGLSGFVQANMQVNHDLIEYVMDLAAGSKKILDLYSGSGNFSIPLALIGDEVSAIERSQLLVSFGKKNAKKNQLGNVRFLCLDTKRAFQSIINESVRFDTIVLNPPRQGVKDILEMIPQSSASRIIYISCNPTTLARDLAYLVDHGFSMKSIRMFDMFPQTYHIESVSLLQR